MSAHRPSSPCSASGLHHCRSLCHSPHLQDCVTEAPLNSYKKKLHRQKVQDPQQDASRRSSSDFKITTEVEQVLPVDPSPPAVLKYGRTYMHLCA
jgi:hypothetical protein